MSQRLKVMLVVRVVELENRCDVLSQRLNDAADVVGNLCDRVASLEREVLSQEPQPELRDRPSGGDLVDAGGVAMGERPRVF